MPTFTSPVSLAQFQTYLKDTSTDPTITAFYQTLLDSATDYVYDWLDRDYTPSATKVDVFWGDNTSTHYTFYPVGSLLSWIYTDTSNVTTNPGTSDMFIRTIDHAAAGGRRVDLKTLSFVSNAEHKITYQQPSTLTCPETVRQVITEIAATLFVESNQGQGSLGLLSTSDREAGITERERYLDLTDRHREMLRPYKRYAV